MDGVTMRLEGAAGLDAALRKLEAKIGKKLGGRALRAGAKLIQKEAASRAPVAEKGLIPPSVKVRAGKRKGKTRDYINIIVATAQGWFKGSAFYAAFLEFGHFAGSRKLGDARAWVPPQPFVGPAWKAKRHAVLAKIISVMRSEFEREAGTP